MMVPFPGLRQLGAATGSDARFARLPVL